VSLIAAANRITINYRFAQPSRSPGQVFPFADLSQTDPQTGLSDGLLTHKLDEQTRPKIFYFNTTREYWWTAAALIHTHIDGKRDVPLPDDVRVYTMAGTQHTPGPFPPTRTVGQQMNNPLNYVWTLRALLTAMDSWIVEGIEPPASRYPRIDRRELVPASALEWPQIPGASLPSGPRPVPRLKIGPDFWTDGPITIQPPEKGQPYPVLVLAVDRDGNDLGGIRLPDVAVPLATYTGWNLYDPRFGMPNELSGLGAYIPFPRTKAERETGGDPRPSIEERYPSREHYLGLVVEAALELAQEGYLLNEDVPAIVRHAGQHWAHLMVLPGQR
jgi:hypothetical protein